MPSDERHPGGHISPRYAIYPGSVGSRSDGDVHHITAGQLRALYRVRQDECIVVYPHESFDPSKREKLERASNLIPLTPRYDGNYTLPTAGAGFKRLHHSPQAVFKGATLLSLSPRGTWLKKRSEERYLARDDAYGLRAPPIAEIGVVEQFRFIVSPTTPKPPTRKTNMAITVFKSSSIGKSQIEPHVVNTHSLLTRAGFHRYVIQRLSGYASDGEAWTGTHFLRFVPCRRNHGAAAVHAAFTSSAT
jgi:hypothetical protein